MSLNERAKVDLPYMAELTGKSEEKITDPEQFTMEIGGKVFTEKKEAGAALLAVCKDIKAVDAAMDIGCLLYTSRCV